ncbi:MAG TPA: Zn-binding domain-containing protein, partial [Thermodesulfobacteriota bacterium]|nr:Zn-binding domain-containing protein [Thermodesulfobacteriota bacterium]
AVVDPHNSVIVSKHLVCAAAEIPLRGDETAFPVEKYTPLLDELVAGGDLLRSASGREFFSHRLNPHRLVDIRCAGEGYTIFEEESKRLIGKISVPRVYSECHPGAVYLHRAESYLVSRLDQGNREAWAGKVEVDYYTRALTEKETEILSVRETRAYPHFTACYGRVKVTERVRAFEKRRIFGQDLLGVQELEMPPHIYETMGLWMILPEEMPRRFKEEGHHFMGGIHAVEHGSIALFPLFALCDRNDIGGICYPVHPQLEKPAIFIYDGYPGGVGITEYGYGVLEELLRKTLSLIRDCPCVDGCPSCIHSPKCGAGNKPLDKAAAQAVLTWLLEGPPPEMEKAVKTTVVLPQLPAPEPVSAAAPVEAATAVAPAFWAEEMSRRRILFLDIETQRSAEEVGGWHNKHMMRLAAAVVYDSKEDSFCVFEEERVHDLIEKLKTADLIVGFNIADFDYQVLRGYSSFRFQQMNTFDLLKDINGRLGYRLSLSHLAQKTLKTDKCADGLQSIAWFKEGKIEEVITYCRKDVEITKDLFLFGLANGYLLFETKAGQLVRLPVEWKIPELLQKGR